MVGTLRPLGLRSFSTQRRCRVDVKTTSEPRTYATANTQGLDVRELPILQPREKYFLLTSPFIEPGHPPPFRVHS
jgi:hypothetical protein